MSSKRLMDLEIENANLREENARFREEIASYKAQRGRWKFLPDSYPQPSQTQLTDEILPAAWRRGKALAPHWFKREPWDFPQQWVKAFVTCFTAMATMRRAETVDMKHDKQMLVDATADRAKEMGFWNAGEIDLDPFIVAVLASNDIPYMALDRCPHNLAFGLKFGDVGTRSSGQGWQDLLAGKFMRRYRSRP